MAISWQAQHEVYRGCPPAPDYLAFHGERVVGRIFQIRSGRNAGCWLWTVMGVTAGELTEPPSGVEEQQGAAIQALLEAYESVACLPASSAINKLARQLR